jgi:ribosomal protein L15
MIAKVHHLVRIEEIKQDRMEANTLEFEAAARLAHRKVRVGRGMGSKMGKTAGAGNKGQQSGAAIRGVPDLKAARCRCTGGLPKRGFSSPFPKTFAVVNVESLNVPFRRATRSRRNCC